MLTLTPLTDAEYAEYLATSIRDYADDKVAAGNWSAEEALERSRAEFARHLPQGPGTADNYLFALRAEPEPGAAPVQVGVLWFAVMPKSATRRWAFVYDFVIFEPYRRRGLAQAALRALETEVRALGLDEIGLHVFGHNQAARALYEKMGFGITNINMSKRLAP